MQTTSNKNNPYLKHRQGFQKPELKWKQENKAWRERKKSRTRLCNETKKEQGIDIQTNQELTENR